MVMRSNMRKIKIALIFAALACCLLALSGCAPMLASPTGLRIDQDTLVLTWNQSEQADYYLIELNGTQSENKIRTNSYSLESLDPGTYQIRLKAVDVDGLYRDSAWSETKEFVREEESGLSYRLIDGNRAYEVVGVGSASGEIVIDDEFRGKPVTSIGKSAFSNATGITEVTIGNNVTIIKDHAFYNCRSLERVIIPETVEVIEQYASQSCRSLSEINLPAKLTEIADYTFSYCSALTQIGIPSGVTSIGKYAFNECTALQQVTFGERLTSIGEIGRASCRERV